MKTFICRTKWSLPGTSNKQTKSLSLRTPRVILINMSGKLGIDIWWNGKSSSCVLPGIRFVRYSYSSSAVSHFLEVLDWLRRNVQRKQTAFFFFDGQGLLGTANTRVAHQMQGAQKRQMRLAVSSSATLFKHWALCDIDTDTDTDTDTDMLSPYSR
jgi:hypothetical protein